MKEEKPVVDYIIVDEIQDFTREEIQNNNELFNE